METINENDTFLICSDGLTNMISDEEIVEIIKNNIEEPNKKLIEAANNAGGADNITVIVILG